MKSRRRQEMDIKAAPARVSIDLNPWGTFNPEHSFHQRAGMIRRPCIPISDEDREMLDAHPSGADIYDLGGGTLVTYGDADSGSALMFITEESIKDLMPFFETE